MHMVPRAPHHAAAVARLAPPVAAAVEGAARARPHAAARCPRRHVDAPRMPVVQLLPAARHSRRPHGVRAVVGHGEGGRVGSGREEDDDDEREEVNGSHFVHFLVEMLMHSGGNG